MKAIKEMQIMQVLIVLPSTKQLVNTFNDNTYSNNTTIRKAH